MSKLTFFLLLFSLQIHSFAQTRSVIDFNKDWKFSLSDDTNAKHIKYDDSHWRIVNLPHDWSIESAFSNQYPATNQGGALPGGMGWYRKTFSMPASAKNEITKIVFDGIYRNSEVWINGQYLGKRPNGYINFSYEIAPWLFYDKPNTISVRVDNSQQPNSRWYTGSGIYRDTKLITRNSTAIDESDIAITTPVVNKANATVKFDVKIIRPPGHMAKFVKLIAHIYSQDGNVLGTKVSWIRTVLGTGRMIDSLTLANPKLWSIENPNLYKIQFQLFDNAHKLLDQYETRFGVRSFYFDPQKGFFLNDRPLKIKGVCLHHDLGALGSAFNKSAARRQLSLLKEMGCNAIRTAHNPPAAAFLDLCDEMGFLVLEEAFDMWAKRKNKFDYHLDFEVWEEKDLQAMILRDRNHPSIFMWSIGNEIREQFDSSGIELATKLVKIIKYLDNTRPITSALTENYPEKNFIYLSGALDVLGFNYKPADYPGLPKRFPNQKLLATETASALETRGVYDQPSDSIRIWPPDSKPFTGGNWNKTVSAYDNTYAYWGTTHEKAWLAVKKYEFIAGCFAWCGIDFLGEPVPYQWPARSSYYGIIDLAGFPKDVYYMYQSEWTNKPVLHLFPAWQGTPGQPVDIWAYYNNADEVELFLNGRSLGKKQKSDTQLHVMWRVPFERGTLRAVSTKGGHTILTTELKAPNKPAKLKLEIDPHGNAQKEGDLYFVTVGITDDQGTVVADASNQVQFSITGNAKILGTDNGYQADTTCLKDTNRNAWKGKALVIIQPTGKQGNITLKATSPGLAPATLHL